MSLTVEVSLISGKTVSLQAHRDESVDSLRVRAQRALRVGKGRLLNSTGLVLDGDDPIKTARLQKAEPLTLHVRRVDIRGTARAFAAILGDASIVTWGDADSSAVQDQLKNVQQVQATYYSFAAILGDGSVVTWGDAGPCGDISGVRGKLKNVQQIGATNGAFAAILDDGSVVTWGSASVGGDSSAVRDRLNHVQHIQSTQRSFAAILRDGSVATWGDAEKAVTALLCEIS